MSTGSTTAPDRRGAFRRASSVAAEITASLTSRMRRAEGGLLAVNASIALAGRGEPVRILWQVTISGALLTLLYLHNDLVDGETDLSNPKKDARRVERLIRRRALLARLLPLLLGVTLATAYWTIGRGSAISVAGVIAINALYCHVLKRTALFDVLAIGGAGALFTLVPGVPLEPVVLVLVAAMTSASHVFQTLADREADLRSGIRTIAVYSPRVAFVTLAVCCAAAALATARSFGPAPAALAALPLIAHSITRDAERAWLVSKVGFGVLWIALLYCDGVVDAPA